MGYGGSLSKKNIQVFLKLTEVDFRPCGVDIAPLLKEISNSRWIIQNHQIHPPKL